MNQITIKPNGIKKTKLQAGISYRNHHLVVEKNQIVDQQIHLHINRLRDYTIELSDHSSGKLMIEINDIDPQSRADLSIKTLLGQNASWQIVVMTQIEGVDTTFNLLTTLKQDSQLSLYGGFISTNLLANLKFDLVGVNASLELNTITVSSNRDSQNLDFTMHHQAPSTIANMTNLAIAGKHGVITLNGIGQIDQGMNQSSDYQTLKGIMISNDAVININPILIIDEFDVKAGHAATVGKLEEEVLFYLRSRGLSLIEAQQLLINSFVHPIINQISDQNIKERYHALINQKT